ncbi:MAG: hypothetical protein QXO78_02305 [Desulfurococcaceae archaeon]
MLYVEFKLFFRYIYRIVPTKLNKLETSSGVSYPPVISTSNPPGEGATNPAIPINSLFRSISTISI